MINCSPIDFCVRTFTPYSHKTNFCVHIYIYIYIYIFVFGNFVVVFKYGCYLCPIYFKRCLLLIKGGVFGVSTNEPPQGMLCLDIGLFNQHS
jgi:hypothetical protein